MARTRPGWKARAPGHVRARIVPALLTLASIGAVVYLAVRSTQKAQPTAAEAGLLTLVATATSLLGAWFLARIGRADPRQARSAVWRLLVIGQTLGKRLHRIDPLMGGGDEDTFVLETRALCVEVAAALPGLEASIGEWNAIHKYTLDDVISEQDQIHGMMAGEQ